MRDHLALQIQPPLAGQTVTLAGWVDTRRDHGGVIFVDLRDRSGIVQVVADPDEAEAFKIAESLRGEFVIAVTGTVRERPDDTANTALATGAVEVMARQISVLNASEPLPFQLDEAELSESVRLKHRYLDLRRPMMQKGIRMRHAVFKELRRYLNERDFVEIETPILTRSTPEGARDYLVPSRTQPGSFFALPQSPQLFKQLLMVGGFERYYQIARCFRDEDLRADRQPEFTQLDVEMSFINEDDVINLMETMMRQVFKNVIDVDLPATIPHMTYADAMYRYGSDRPDLRIKLELTDVTDLMKQVEFKVFAGPANADDGRVAALCVPGAGSLSRAQIDQYTEFVKPYGAKGLAYIKVNNVDSLEGLQSPILKFLPEPVAMDIVSRCGAKAGDMIFFGADSAKVVNDALGALRVRIGNDLELAEDGWQPLWVIDFPLVEYDADAIDHKIIRPRVNRARVAFQFVQIADFR